jgi:hypothetical protein
MHQNDFPRLGGEASLDVFLKSSSKIEWFCNFMIVSITVRWLYNYDLGPKWVTYDVNYSNGEHALGWVSELFLPVFVKVNKQNVFGQKVIAIEVLRSKTKYNFLWARLWLQMRLNFLLSKCLFDAIDSVGWHVLEDLLQFALIRPAVLVAMRLALWPPSVSQLGSWVRAGVDLTANLLSFMGAASLLSLTGDALTKASSALLWVILAFYVLGLVFLVFYETVCLPLAFVFSNLGDPDPEPMPSLQPVIGIWFAYPLACAAIWFKLIPLREAILLSSIYHIWGRPLYDHLHQTYCRAALTTLTTSYGMFRAAIAFRIITALHYFLVYDGFTWFATIVCCLVASCSPPAICLLFCLVSWPPFFYL